MKKFNGPLTFILGIHIAMGTAFGLTTPIFEAPDEDSHFLFVRYLQLHHALPVQGTDPNGPRAHHPPLYFALGALLSAWVPVEGSTDRIVRQVNPHVAFRYGDPHTDNKAMWIHDTPEERWPYAGQALAVHIVRLLSVAFSAAAVWFTYLAALHLRPGDETFALLAAGLLAFNPMVLFMSGVVQNSTSAITSTAAILYWLACFTRQGFTFARWLWVGVVFSLSVLLQTSALVLAMPIGLVLLYEAWRTRRLRGLVEGGLGLLIPMALLDGWWFARNQILYGDWTANAAVAALWGHGPIMPLDVAFYLVGTGMVGRFGQGLMIDYPNPIYLAAGLLALMSVIGLLRSAIVGLRRSRAPNSALVLWLLQIVTILAVSASLTIYVLKYIHGVHGRYMFTAFPSIALLLAAGGMGWFRHACHTRVTIAVLALNLGLAGYGLFGLLIPTYAVPRAPGPAELQRMTPLDADVGGVARVLGYTLNAASVKPGEELAVTIYWRVEARTDVPYTIFLHVYEPSVGSLAQIDTYPGLGNYATTTWDPGRTFADTYRLRVPPDAPAVSDASLVLGLYDEPSGKRLPVTGANAGTADEAWVQFSHIQVQP